MDRPRLDLGEGTTRKNLLDLLGSFRSGTNKGANEILAVIDAIAKGHLDYGPLIGSFEGDFAEKIGSSNATAVGSGTQGLELALESIEIGEGDQVITTPYTWVGTVNPIVNRGAEPKFVDIDIETFAIDVEGIEDVVNEKTRAILPVLPLGFVPDMDQIYQIAAKNDLWVIEDACVALGSKYKGRYVGADNGYAKRVTVFSFCPRKTMTTAGGGMVTTSDEELGRVIKARSYQGNMGKVSEDLVGVHFPGHKHNMGCLHAAIGIEQLKKLEMNLERRQELASIFRTGLQPYADQGIIALQRTETRYDYKHGNCHFPFLVHNSGAFNLAYFILESQMPIDLGFWPPVHLEPFYPNDFR